MPHFFQSLKVPIIAIAVISLLYAPNASAHVVVKPAEAITAGFQTFTIGVPNEKEIPTVKIKLDMPDGLNYVSPTLKAGWTIEVEKEGEGEESKVKSITWSNGSIGQGFRDEFTFAAQVPAKSANLTWKAYQTYLDGTLVAWDQKEEKSGVENNGPYSVTKVVAKTESEKLTDTANSSASGAASKADTALLVGFSGLLVGAGGIFLATRRK